MIAATVIVLGWNHYGMDSVLEISADSAYEMTSIDDHDSGGKSEARLSRDKGRLELACTIKPGYAYPYCEAAIELKRPPHGVDLSQYDSMRLCGPPEARTAQQVRCFTSTSSGVVEAGEDLSLKVRISLRAAARPPPGVHAGRHGGVIVFD